VRAARVWSLNLDAELELAGDGYRRSARMEEHLRRLAAVLRPSLRRHVGAEPVLVEPVSAELRGLEAGELGDAWCPTPRARAVLAAAGCTPVDAPALEVLRAVNHRAFAAGLDDAPEFGGEFCATAAACEAVLAKAPSSPFVLKRALGFAGRLRKVVVLRELGPAARRWIDASMRAHGGGLQVEPWVERLADFALHGFVGRSGELACGRVTVGEYDARGAWLASRLAERGELDDGERRLLKTAFERAAAALAAAGYFGPFGIDAFRWRDRAGRARFRALCDLNARYTMGWFTGFADAPSACA
jgi:hypothetical protein